MMSRLSYERGVLLRSNAFQGLESPPRSLRRLRECIEPVHTGPSHHLWKTRQHAPYRHEKRRARSKETCVVLEMLHDYET